MLSYLKGKIKIKTDQFIVLEVHGIGYKVFVPQNVAENLNQEGEEQELYIYQYVAEDRQELYGFHRFSDLEFFELLISVSGIGPKSALGVMAIASTKTLRQAIVSEDTSVFTKVSGVGQKTAERVILELKNKLPDVIGYRVSTESGEAIDALVELGYPQKQAREVLAKAPSNLTLLGEKIKWALRNL